MRRLLKVSVVLFVISVLLLLLNLFDVFVFPDAVVRICGVVCLVVLFLTVYSRVWLITHRRKYRKGQYK